MFSLSRSFALLTVLLAGSAVGPSSLFAQESDAPALGTVVAEETAAAPAVTVTVARGAPIFPVGIRVASPFVELAPITAFDALALQDRVRPGQNILMMTVGGAALVTGLVVGGDTGTIIATTGAVVALVGLYRYLN